MKEIVTIENAFIDIDGEQYITWKALADGLGFRPDAIRRNMDRNIEYYEALCTNRTGLPDLYKSKKVFDLEGFEVYIQSAKTTQATIAFRMSILESLKKLRLEKTQSALEYSKEKHALTFEIDRQQRQIENDKETVMVGKAMSITEGVSLNNMAKRISSLVGIQINSKINSIELRNLLLDRGYIARSNVGEYYPLPQFIPEYFTYEKSGNSSKYLLRLTPKGQEMVLEELQ